MIVYLIPGLGFDNRIFKNLKLSEIEYKYLNWIEPKENEKIKNYANRLSQGIKETSEKIILIGHSFGGIVAQEIAALRPIHQIILISSIKSGKELPFHFRIMKPLFIHKLFSKELTAITIKFWGKNHDYETIEEQDFVTDMVNNQSNYNLQWALRQLSIWDKPKSNHETKIIQIHGELDKTFPVKLISEPSRIIQKAGHFMVYKKATLLNDIIESELTNKNGMQQWL